MAKKRRKVSRKKESSVPATIITNIDEPVNKPKDELWACRHDVSYVTDWNHCDGVCGNTCLVDSKSCKYKPCKGALCIKGPLSEAHKDEYESIKKKQCKRKD